MTFSHVAAAFVAAFFVTQLAIFSTTVYLHRALSHRALTVRPAAALPFRAVIWITTGMRPREWVAVHRKHHAATDTDEDPHSPARVGFWRVQLGNVGLYKRAAADPANLRKYAREAEAVKLFERAPEEPKTDALKASLEKVLAPLGVSIAAWKAEPRASQRRTLPATVPEGQRFELTPDDVRGIIDVRLELTGARARLTEVLPKLPPHLQGIPAVASQTKGKTIMVTGRDDNSNSQFAMLALWAARTSSRRASSPRSAAPKKRSPRTRSIRRRPRCATIRSRRSGSRRSSPTTAP